MESNYLNHPNGVHSRKENTIIIKDKVLLFVIKKFLSTDKEGLPLLKQCLAIRKTQLSKQTEFDHIRK